MSERASVAELLAKAELILQQNKIADPRLDARLLLQHVLGVSHARLISMNRDLLEAAQQLQFEEAIERRSHGEPVHRITGTREFFGREFVLSAETLVPRPETEILVEAAIGSLNGSGAPANILEIGVGSGAIAISLAAALKDCRIVATDISDDALATARANAERCSVDDRIEFVNSNLFDNITGSFDLIVSNPPYIPSDEIARLDREVRDHDPVQALDGGVDGLDFYAEIFGEGPNHLCQNGVIMVEFGIGQTDAIRALAEENGLKITSVLKDLSGIERVMALNRPV